MAGLGSTQVITTLLKPQWHDNQREIGQAKQKAGVPKIHRNVLDHSASLP